MSKYIKYFSMEYAIQHTGVMGVPIALLTYNEKTLFPATIISKRPRQRIGSQAGTVTYTYLSSHQFNSPFGELDLSSINF